jgi:hypothetical protein
VSLCTIVVSLRRIVIGARRIVIDLCTCADLARRITDAGRSCPVVLGRNVVGARRIVVSLRRTVLPSAASS